MSPRNFARSALAVAALVSGLAYADTIHFRFTGTVTYSTYIAPVGSPITGSFAWDADNSDRLQKRSKDLPPGYNQNYADYQIPQPFNISATAGGHVISSTNLGVAVFNDQGGNVEDMVVVSGWPAIVDGTTYASGVLGFQLASGVGNTHVLHNTRLPRSFDVQQFDAPAMNGGYLMSDGGQTGTLLSFTIDSIEVVETPR